MKAALKLCAVLFTSFGVSGADIQITQAPAVGEIGNVVGIVAGIDDYTKYKVAIVIRVFGTYWSKPTFANPSAPLYQGSENIYFDSGFITGGQDFCADRIVVFLVRAEFSIPLVSGGTDIPRELQAAALAVDEWDRAGGGSSSFEWSGHTWEHKITGDCVWGPGPNHFSKDSAWVDAQGRLHLVVRFVNGKWRCGEIILRESLGYGRYSFHISSDLRSMPTNIVFGAFIYDVNTGYEMDIEHNNGPVIGKPFPWQYVVQPWQNPGNRHRFDEEHATNVLVHTFAWLPGTVQFSTFDGPPQYTGKYNGKYRLVWSTIPNGFFFNLAFGSSETFTLMPADTKEVSVSEPGTWYPERFYKVMLEGITYETENQPLEEWTRFEQVPPAGTEQFRLNLWLHDGNPPGTEAEEFEVVIDKFQFESLSSILNLESLRPSLQLLDLDLTIGEAHFRVKVP